MHSQVVLTFHRPYELRCYETEQAARILRMTAVAFICWHQWRVSGTVQSKIFAYQEPFVSIYERFRTESGDWQISTLPQKYISQRLSRMKPVAARNWLKALRALLDFAVAEGFRNDNPAVGVRLPKHKSAGHHCWEEAEIAQFESYWPIDTRERDGLLHYCFIPHSADPTSSAWGHNISAAASRSKSTVM
jgi:hypothetical protein